MKKPKIENKIEKEIVETANKIERFEWRHRNLFFLLISILVAYLILKSAYIRNLIENAGAFSYIGSFIIGMFYTYGLTTVPAVAAFLVISKNLNPLLIALVGAIGSVISEYIIFRFIGDKVILGFEEIAGDLSVTLKKDIEKLRRKTIKSKVSHYLIPIIAGIIIASPLPDELAAVLLGSVKFNLKKFLIYAFIFNFIGIFLIATIGGIF